MIRPFKRTLVKLYRGKDPYRWLSIMEIAKRYRTNSRTVKGWLAYYKIPIRTRKENFEKVKACMRRGGDPRHFSGLERRARGILEELGYFRGTHWRHNFKVGTASIDFWFPGERFALEVDSVWHDRSTRWWRGGTVSRQSADRKRDEKLVDSGARVSRVRWYSEAGAEVGIFLAMRQIGGKE